MEFRMTEVLLKIEELQGSKRPEDNAAPVLGS